MFYFQFVYEKNLFHVKHLLRNIFVSRFRYKKYVSIGRPNCVAFENYFGITGNFSCFVGRKQDTCD